MDKKKKLIFTVISALVIILTFIYVSYISRVQSLLKIQVKISKQPNKLQSKYVTLSNNMDFEKDFYMFYLPMVCQGWRQVGFEPIVILVVPQQGDTFVNLSSTSYQYSDEKSPYEHEFNATLNSLDLKVIQYLEYLNVKVFYMRSFPGYESQLGQLSRLLPGFLSKEYISDENDLIILSDSDLIPVRKSYYTMNEVDHVETNAIKIWNAFCCEPFYHRGREFDHYPMSHVGMRKHQWRYLFEGLIMQNQTIRMNRESVVSVFNTFYGKNCFFTKNEKCKFYLLLLLSLINIINEF